MVILDGLAELTYVGFEPVRIQQFIRAILSLVRNVSTLPSDSAMNLLLECRLGQCVLTA